jgi:hypothetical protein
VEAIKIHPGHHGRFTRQTTRTAALNAVFGTSELLLQILRNLNAQSLLDMRRLNKQYDALILSDPVMQRKLFLAPLLTAEKVQWIMDKVTRVIKLYHPGEERIRGEEWTKRQGAVKLAQLNPIVFKRVDGT